MRCQRYRHSVAEPSLLGESSDTARLRAQHPEGGPRGKLVSPVKQAKRCVMGAGGFEPP